MFISHYKFSDETRLKVKLKNGTEGLLVSYDSKDNYANILFKSDNYSKSVPVSHIEQIIPSDLNFNY